jgi:hypothetical protein
MPSVIAARYRPGVRDWIPIVLAVVVVAAVVLREVMRWRGRRWQRRATPGRERPVSPDDDRS